jgi:hypothetical protein
MAKLVLKGLVKESKKGKNKYPKSETEPYNPWAVCTESVGRDDKEKYESCVKQVKEQNKERNKNKKSKESSENKLMEKVAGLLEDAGVATGGQGRMTPQDYAAVRNALGGKLPLINSLIDSLSNSLNTPNMTPNAQMAIQKFMNQLQQVSNQVQQVESNTPEEPEQPEVQ